jgi:hypothetical protein
MVFAVPHGERVCVAHLEIVTLPDFFGSPVVEL